jgi:ubiquinone/menaquinone biosynthesis C-methylase UbiE
MSSLALMRWLENSPGRYDAGMRLLTFGRVAELHAAVAAAAVSKPGDRVLEIGCGTGAVTALLVARGARVVAIDQAPEMLEQAIARLGPEAPVEWLEQTASEIDRLPMRAFESVVLSLCLSDMSASERSFVLCEAALRLAAEGRLVAADEVRAAGRWQRFAQRLWRIPQAALGWLLIGAVSQPLGDLSGELRAAGLHVSREESFMFGTLGLVVAESGACHERAE